MQNNLAAVHSNIHFIQQGVDLLSSVSDELYTKNNGPFNKSGIGKHFRHIIEHYISLIESNYTGLVDYDARARDLRLETDREFMINSLKSIVSSLTILTDQTDLLDNRIQIRSNEGVGEENSPVSESTVRRELQFLISHTVHHYALIGLILETLGFKPEDSFGVAPSTLKYEQQQQAVDKAS